MHTVLDLYTLNKELASRNVTVQLKSLSQHLTIHLHAPSDVYLVDFLFVSVPLLISRLFLLAFNHSLFSHVLYFYPFLPVLFQPIYFHQIWAAHLLRGTRSSVLIFFVSFFQCHLYIFHCSGRHLGMCRLSSACQGQWCVSSWGISGPYKKRHIFLFYFL